MDRACVIPGPNNVPPLAVGAKENGQPGADRVAPRLSLCAGERLARGTVDRARGLLGQRQQGVALVVEVRIERSVARIRQRNDVSDSGRGEAEFRRNDSRAAAKSRSRVGPLVRFVPRPVVPRVPPFVSRRSVDAKDNGRPAPEPAAVAKPTSAKPQSQSPIQNLIAKRVSAATEHALDGPNQSLRRAQKPVWDALNKYYFRLEMSGWDRLPGETSLLIGNHSGRVADDGRLDVRLRMVAAILAPSACFIRSRTMS